MKNFFFVLVICCTVISFSADKSYAQEIVLNASEVSQLFADKTMQIVNETKAKSDKQRNYKAYASETGGLEVIFYNGVRQHRSWVVGEDGAFCIRGVVGRRRSGVICGYIVPQGNNVYKMYKAKRVYKKDGQVVGGKQVKLLFTFSNLKKGNSL